MYHITIIFFYLFFTCTFSYSLFRLYMILYRHPCIFIYTPAFQPSSHLQLLYFNAQCVPVCIHICHILVTYSLSYMSYLKSVIYELLTVCHIWVTYNLSYMSYLQSVIYELLTICHIWVTYSLSYMSYLKSVIYELLTVCHIWVTYNLSYMSYLQSVI